MPISRPRALSLVLGVLAVAALLAAPSSAGTQAAGTTPGRGPSTDVRTVTLITGDVVRIGPDGKSAAIVPAPGRPVRAVSLHTRGHHYLIPYDALPLVTAGKLDRRLFDLTELVRGRYDDAHTTEVPVIVAAGRSAAATTGPGRRRVRSLRSIGAEAIRVTKAAARASWVGWREQLRSGGVARIWLDARLQPVLDHSVPQIGAPTAWQAGFTGSGVIVAVLDSGIDAAHPDLAGQIAAAKNFTLEPDGDAVGHGTHVAATIASTGAAGGGRYRGVAPDARLLDAKVCEEFGCDLSAIVAGMEWAAVEQRADVINLSLGGEDTPDTDPLEAAISELSRSTGALFTVSAGNAGVLGAGSVGSPGGVGEALTVGAVDREDQLAGFSSRGPVRHDGRLKPDVTAPGVGIVAARAARAAIGEQVGSRYLRLSGTSMAAPHAAGAAALLAQQHPDWSRDRLKAALMASAQPRPGTPAYDQGAGRVDLGAAIGQRVLTEPASLSFGIARWPHADDQALTKTLTYLNTGDAPLNLRLTAELTGPDGGSAPAGAVRLSAHRLQVPAGGTAEVRVGVDTRHDGPDGGYSGRITAAADGHPVATTPIGVVKEVESYDLDLRVLDQSGQLAQEGFAFVLDRAGGAPLFAYYSDGVQQRLRLPKGTYTVGGEEVIGEWAGFHRVLQPVVELNGPTSLMLDTRLTEPVRMTIDRPDVRPALVELGFAQRLPGSDLLTGVSFANPDFEDVRTARIGPPSEPGTMTSYLTSHWAVPGPEGTFRNSSVSYHPMSILRDGFWTGFQREVSTSQLAAVEGNYRSQGGNRTATRWMLGRIPDSGTFPPLGADLPWDPPHRVTHYVEPAPVSWSGLYLELEFRADGLPMIVTTQRSEPREYAAGRTYHEDWNGAVLGPAVPDAQVGTRTGDVMTFDLPLFSDRANHAGIARADGNARLYRGDDLVAESGMPDILRATVPSGPGWYRLSTRADRSGAAELSTTVAADWRFRSAGDGPLPLWAVRFLPAVDNHNAAPATPVTRIPFSLQVQPGATAGHPARVTVQLSGDDGRTWRPATARRLTDGRYVATASTPPGAPFVSLRASVVDTAGNSVTETVVRAFRLTR